MSAPLLIAVMGPPGSGKGTQCARLARMFDAAHLSAGDLLRREVASATTVGTTIRRSVEGGRLVADQIVTELVKTAIDRHRDQAMLLDGFPRTLAQMQLLDAAHPGALRQAIELVLPVSVLMRRLGARGRADDQPTVVRQRLVSYAQETWPLLRWFSSRGMLMHIDGAATPDTVTSAIREHLLHVGIRAADVLA